MKTKLRCVFDMPAEELAAATASLAAAPGESIKIKIFIRTNEHYNENLEQALI